MAVAAPRLGLLVVWVPVVGAGQSIPWCSSSTARVPAGVCCPAMSLQWWCAFCRTNAQGGTTTLRDARDNTLGHLGRWGKSDSASRILESN